MHFFVVAGLAAISRQWGRRALSQSRQPLQETRDGGLHAANLFLPLPLGEGLTAYPDPRRNLREFLKQ